MAGMEKTDVSENLSNLCRLPVLPAPMAGGPTTPQLVIDAFHAGSLGTLGLGTASVENAKAQIDEVESAGVGFGVNFFYPQPPLSPQLVEAARKIAAEEGVEMPDVDYTFGWHAKLDYALTHAHPRLVWAMFGVFEPDEIARIHAAGAQAWVTVTCELEAITAARAGVDVICVQGPEAGGHRGTWAVDQQPDTRELEDLVRAVAAELDAAGLSVPLVAAGGLRNAADVAEALSWPGVEKVSCGSAFLLSDAAGTSPANRDAVAAAKAAATGNAGGAAAANGKAGTAAGAVTGAGTAEATVSTRAFSGRPARGLATVFTKEHPDMPGIYPFLNPILKPRRARGDAAVAYCLVGTRPGEINGGSVAEILDGLCPNKK